MDIFGDAIVKKTSKTNVLAGFMIIFLIGGAISPSYSLPSKAIDVVDNLNNVPNFSSSNSKSPSFVPNQIIIGFKQGLSQESIEDFYSDFSPNYGLSEKKNLNSDNSKIPITKLVSTTVPVNSNLIEKLQSDNRVDFVEPDYLLSINTNDSYYNLLWGLENVGQDIRGNTGKSDADIDAPEAWSKLGTTNKVIIGIIDTGVDYDHEDLAAHMWTNVQEATGVSGFDDDGNGYVDDVHGWNAYRNNGNPDDDNGHGSHTAGTIGAVGSNNKGIIGISQDVEIIACKFLSRSGSGSTSDAIECFNYFNKLRTQGYDVRVTNNSWGGGGYSSALYNAMNNSDILHVVAAGNSGVNIDSSPQYPASYPLPNIIAVAATDFNDNYASFSNYGNSVDIAAPGVDIASTYKNNGYVWMSGTSMAAPHVTGAAALAFSADDSLSTSSVKNLIMENADTLADHSKFSYQYHRLNVDKILSQISPYPVTETAPVISSVVVNSAGTQATITWSPGDANSGPYTVQRTSIINGAETVDTNASSPTIDTFTALTQSGNICYTVTDGSTSLTSAEVCGPFTYVPPSSNLSVETSADSSNYSTKSFVYITVNVSDNNNPVSGSSVSIVISDPNNNTVNSQSGITDNNGSITFKYRLSPKADLGTYEVLTEAIASGYVSKSSSTSFTVS